MKRRVGFIEFPFTSDIRINPVPYRPVLIVVGHCCPFAMFNHGNKARVLRIHKRLLNDIEV